MKIRKTSFAFFALTALTQAQVYSPPSAPAPSPAPAPTDTVVTEKKSESKSPLGEEIPLLDPAAETLTVGGVNIPLGDNRVLKARFEKYLNEPAESSEAALQYREDIASILAELSPYREGGPRLREGFKLLPRATTYPGDSNLCGSLAEAVYVAMLAKKDVNGLKELNESLEQEKKSAIGKADWDARHDDKKSYDNETSGGGKKGGGGNQRKKTTSEGHGVKAIRYKEHLRRIAEIEILKKANIVKTEAQTLQTKVQYQVNMVQWFTQRRFEHVLMASRFYNQIWKDGDTTLHIDESSDVSKLFTQSVGVSPTVASLDSLSNEAIRDAEKAVEAFNYLVDQGELHTASQRLLEAFALGEYLTPIATLPRERKRKIQLYTREINELYSVMQARDYKKAKTLIASLKTQAKDFPSAKADSAVAGFTLASDLAIEKAKTHLLSGDNDKASEEIQAAAEIWPTNPKLTEFRDLVSNSSSVVLARNDFDRLLSEKNYREILRRQFEFAKVIDANDTTRQDALKQILENLARIERSLAQANEFQKIGNGYGAWEQLASMRKEFPDDPKLGLAIEKLSTEVAVFVDTLNTAKRLEDASPQQVGSSMSHYLKAKSLYPQSSMAEEGIQRLLDVILPDAGI